MRVSSKLDSTEPVQKSQENSSLFTKRLRFSTVSPAPGSGNAYSVTPQKAFIWMHMVLFSSKGVVGCAHAFHEQSRADGQVADCKIEHPVTGAFDHLSRCDVSFFLGAHIRDCAGNGPL